MNNAEQITNRTYNINQNGLVAIPLNANHASSLLVTRININKKGASSNTMTVYDSTETLGENTDYIIGTFDTTDQTRTIPFNHVFTRGILIRVATGTAPDATIFYKEFY